MTTPSLPDALRACIELGEKNPPGDLMLATGCSWRRILVGLRQLPYLVPSIDIDGHPNLECGEQFAHAEEVIACTNLIRQHGPALEALLRELEWRPIECSLPEDGDTVLCYESWKGNILTSQFIAEMVGGKPGFVDEFYDKAATIDGCPGGWGHWPFVTHWMPLPAGPKP